MLHHILICRETPLIPVFRPAGHHQGFLLRHKGTVDFLRDERHERVQELQRLSEYRLQHPEHTVRCRPVRCRVVDPVFRKLNIPVTELIPDEVINLLHGNAQLKLVHVFRHVFCKSVDPGQDPAVRRRQQGAVRLLHYIFLHIHKDKTRRVPYLVCKIPACLHALIVETHVVSRRVSCDKGQPQGVCTVLVDDLQRIDPVP